MYTEDYIPANVFTKNPKQLMLASHWLDPLTGEQVKLSHNLKAVYLHKLDQFNSFSSKGCPYKESNQRVADLLGLDRDTVQKKITPILKRMGLIEVKKLGHKKYVTTVHSLENLNGSIINPLLSKHMGTLEDVKKASFSSDQWRAYQRNKKLLALIKANPTFNFDLVSNDLFK